MTKVRVIGIDVGGRRKGFHAVFVEDMKVQDVYACSEPQKVYQWCVTCSARAIGVDAPCHWSLDGRQRTAEREMAADHISCSSTPTEATAIAHPTDYYGWMHAGMRLYGALRPTFPLLSNNKKDGCCFETFPYAVSRALAGAEKEPKPKVAFRRDVLRAAGLTDLSKLRNIDFVDAALCAIAAIDLLRGAERQYGRETDGLIIVPSPAGVS
jgi:predicted nuclease with RNAse H fold